MKGANQLFVKKNKISMATLALMLINFGSIAFSRLNR